MRGSFEGLEADLRFDPAQPERSTIVASVDASTAESGIGLRDKHLMNQTPMMRTAEALLASLILALLTGAPGQLFDPPATLSARRDGGERFYLPDDLEVTLWAESPRFFNPTNIDIDVRGRVWVAEAVNYRDFNNKPEDHLHHAQGDRIVILEDTDGDGTADTSTVFVQDEDLRAPLGIAVLGNRVIVSSAPSLIVYTDEDGDDRPDKKEVLLTGFGGYDHDHGLHAVVAGPDGNLYFNTGNAGPHVVTDRAGWTLRSGSLYTGGTPHNTENQGAQVSDDGRVWVGGLALRMAPDGTGLKVMAHNFRNAYELTVDAFGNLWQNDNDDEVLACRVTWLMEGSNAGFFSADGTRTWQADRRPGQDTFTAHWHQEDPGVLPAGDRTGAGAPTGIVRYEGDQLGPSYRGMLLSADAGRNAVFGYHPAPQGAGFRLDRIDLITTVEESTAQYVWNADVREDKRKWFRPSDVAVGPDGALYVADWYDPVVGGHQMHDSVGYGRIYRITPKGRPLHVPEIDLRTTEGQLQALVSPAVNVRALGFAGLKAQGAKAVSVVVPLLKGNNPYHRARALWLLACLGPEGRRRVAGFLDDPDEQIRLTAFRALRAEAGDVLPLVERMAGDASPAVRREVALALRSVPPPQRTALLRTLAEGYDGEDAWYLEALGLAAEGQAEPLYAALKRDRDGAPEAWDARMAGLAWRLHPPSAVPDFQARAASRRVPPEARRKALTALAFVDDAAAARAMADLTHSDLPDVAAQANWWMAFRTTNAWRSYPVEGWAGLPTTAVAAHSDMTAPFAAVTDDTLTMDHRLDAAMTMASDPVGGLLLVSLAVDKKLPYQLHQSVRPALRTNPDRTVRVLARHYFDGSQGQVRAAAAVSVQTADPERGRLVFTSTCAACHRVGEMGGTVGPELTAAGQTLGREDVVEAILQPGAAVAHGYTPLLVTTKDGAAVCGFLLADGAEVVIKDAAGQVHTLDRGRIATRQALEASLMPSPDVLGLSEQDVADVAAFLLAP